MIVVVVGGGSHCDGWDGVGIGLRFRRSCCLQLSSCYGESAITVSHAVER